jgi:hypothetical protein
MSKDSDTVYGMNVGMPDVDHGFHDSPHHAVHASAIKVIKN